MEPRIASALDELGAEDRALVELAEVRGIGDDEMAGYLGVAPEEARERRKAALGRLALALGVSPEQARAELSHALPPEGARGDLEPPSPRVPPDDPVAQRVRGREGRARAPERSESSRDRRRRSAALFALLGVVLLAGALTVALASGGDDDDPGSDQGAAADEGEAPTPAGPEVELAPPAAGPGTGTAQVLEGGDRLALRVSGLPDPGDARYAVWLYDTLLEARQIASADRGDFALEARLPRGAARFALLDVSLEPDDGLSRHSGQSVLRVPLSKLIAPVP